MKRSIVAAVALVTMLTAGALGLRGALAANTPVAPVVVNNCCLDPTCLPGCCPDCPPDCCPATASKVTVRDTCPPCPFSP